MSDRAACKHRRTVFVHARSRRKRWWERHCATCGERMARYLPKPWKVDR